MVTITTRMSRQEFKTAFRRQVSEMTKAENGRSLAGFITAEVLNENLKDFLAKSRRQPDREGNRWPELAGITILRKLERIQKNIERTEDPRIAQAIAKGGTVGQIAKQRRANEMKRALAFAGDTQINVDTRRLITSLSPGGMQGGRYRPQPDQQLIVSELGFQAITRVPYAGFVQTGGEAIIENRIVTVPARPIYPPARRAAPWVATGTRKFVEHWARSLSGV